MKTEIIIEKSDLIGEIKDFPIEVVQKMVDNQKKLDVTVFQKDKSALLNGFDWEFSDEGFDFWEEVIKKENFNLFFEKYPKETDQSKLKEIQSDFKSGKLVYYKGDEERGNEVIQKLIDLGGINKDELTGQTEKCIYFISPNGNIDCTDSSTLVRELIEKFYTEASLPIKETITIGEKTYYKEDVEERLNNLKEVK